MKSKSPCEYEENSSTLSKSGSELAKHRIRLVHSNRKRGQKYLEQSEQSLKQKNYFQHMYRQVKKKMYVNLFVRKMKQIIVLRKPGNSQLCEQIKYDFKQRQTVLLNAKLQIIYTILQIIIVLSAMVSSSLTLTFPQINNESPVQVISSLTVIFCFLNICSTFLCRSSIDIKNKKQKYLYINETIKNYKSPWVWVEIILSIIFFIDLVYTSNYLTYAKVFILVKLFTILNKTANLQIILIQNCFKQQYWELTKVFIFNFLFAHFISIILLMMATSSQSWLTKRQLIQQPWHEQYIWAYYWATTIMLTVGFGDITAANSRQALVLIFIQTLTCIILAYNINNVGEIIKKITSYEQEKINNLKVFTQIQGKQNVSQDIKKKITNYITQSAELKRNFNVEEETKLIEKLPKSFYEQFKKQSNMIIFNSIPFFRNLNFSMLRKIALKIDKRLTHPEQIILQSGKVPGVCVVNDGHLTFNINRIGLSSHGKQIQSIKIDPSEYKIISLYFFINKPITYDIKCRDYAMVYSISKEELQTLLCSNPSSYEYYCMAKQKDRFNSNDWQTFLCKNCQDKSLHTLFDCPKLHYVPINSAVVSKANRKTPSVMKYLVKYRTRRDFTNLKVSSLKSYNMLQKITKQFHSLFIQKIHLKSGKTKNKRNGFMLPKQIEKQINFQSFHTLQAEEINNLLNHQISISKKYSPQRRRLDEVCKEMGQKLKDEILRVSYLPLAELGFQVDSDAAHDYTSYFHSHNPNMLCKRKILKTKKSQKKDKFQVNFGCIQPISPIQTE